MAPKPEQLKQPLWNPRGGTQVYLASDRENNTEGEAHPHGRSTSPRASLQARASLENIAARMSLQKRRCKQELIFSPASLEKINIIHGVCNNDLCMWRLVARPCGGAPLPAPSSVGLGSNVAIPISLRSGRHHTNQSAFRSRRRKVLDRAPRSALIVIARGRTVRNGLDVVRETNATRHCVNADLNILRLRLLRSTQQHLPGS